MNYDARKVVPIVLQQEYEATVVAVEPVSRWERFLRFVDPLFDVFHFMAFMGSLMLFMGGMGGVVAYCVAVPITAGEWHWMAIAVSFGVWLVGSFLFLKTAPL